MLKRVVQFGIIVLLLAGAVVGALFAHDVFTRPKLPSYAGSPDKPGSIVSAEHVGSYPPFVFSALLWAAGVKASVPISESPHLYRLTYWSQLGDQPIKLSGLVSIPERKLPRGVAVWLHGTNDDRATSVSAPNLNEGIFYQVCSLELDISTLPLILWGLAFPSARRLICTIPAPSLQRSTFFGPLRHSPRTQASVGPMTSMLRGSRRAGTTQRPCPGNWKGWIGRTGGYAPPQLSRAHMIFETSAFPSPSKAVRPVIRFT